MRREVQEKVNLIGSWESVLISGLGSEKNRWMLGLRMSQIAQKLGKDAYDVAVQLILEEENRVMMCGFGMSEENTRRILKHPLVAVASDGSALAVDGPLSKGHPHPRSFGTFPRVLGKYVREEKLFSLEEAVRKMTSLPAEILQLPLRGKIAKGYYADLVLFDPDRVADRATWENPKQYPEGIVWVLVNGQVVLREGERTPARPGKVLVRKI
jgi:N-acyl-D-amino-acid deacylase